jgi:transposase
MKPYRYAIIGCFINIGQENGINSLTYPSLLCDVSSMQNKKWVKHENLKKAGLLNPSPEQVRDHLFQEHPEFFDPCDNLQVRYEMLRSHLIEHDSVMGVCRRFGVSRQTFYTLLEKLVEEGTAGLLPKKPGPRGASKLRPEVLRYVSEQLEVAEPISAGQIRAEIQQRFAVSIHKRTIEKLLKDLRSKKNSGGRQEPNPRKRKDACGPAPRSIRKASQPLVLLRQGAV